MIKLPDNGKTYHYFDNKVMMLERTHGNHGKGDALWRTSLALIASGLPELKKAITSCVYFVGGKAKFKRHPEPDNTDASRDQAIMALVALKEHAPEEYRTLSLLLSFRISSKFTWTDAWFWAKGKFTFWRILSCYHFIGWWFEPSYSIHLFCWMVWSSGKKMRLIKWYLLKFIVHKENYLLRALLGVKEEIPTLHPMIDFRWQRDTPWLQGRDLTPEEAEYNTLDLDVLDYIRSK